MALFFKSISRRKNNSRYDAVFAWLGLHSYTETGGCGACSETVIVFDLTNRDPGQSYLYFTLCWL